MCSSDLGRTRKSGLANVALQGLRSPAATLRRTAAQVLGWNAKPAGKEPLLALLASDPSRRVRAAAARTLAKHGERQAIPLLLLGLGDPDAALRAAAAAALAPLGEPVPAVWQAAAAALVDEDWTRPALLDPSAAALLRQELTTPETTATRARRWLGAAHALGQQRDRDAVPLLVAALTADPARQRAAAAALGRIGERAAASDLRAAVAATTAPEVRGAMLGALARLGLDEDLPLLEIGRAHV